MSTIRDQIPNLSTAEKLATMEDLWRSLHENLENSDPPSWHRELLKQRMVLIESGGAVYEDWAEVKKQLREPAA